MKRYSLVLGLLLTLVAGPALAADYDLTADNCCPSAGEQVTVELRVDNWAGTYLETFDTCLKYDSSVLEVNSMQINDTSVGGCAAAAFSFTNDNDTDCVRLGGGVIPGTTTCPVADDYLLATVVFDVLNDDYTTTICTGDCDAADDQPCGHNFPEYVEDETGKQYPAEICLNLNSTCPPYIENVLPDPATVDAEETIQFTAIYADGCCFNPPDQVWSDTCSSGDIDPSTGVFTAGTTYVPEDCTVSVFDNANPNVCSVVPGSDCMAALYINALCRTDFDNDGNVYPSDLSVFLGEYGRTDCLTTPPPCQADFDGDGNVYPSDLSIFLEEYGRTDCPVIP